MSSFWLETAYSAFLKNQPEAPWQQQKRIQRGRPKKTLGPSLAKWATPRSAQQKPAGEQSTREKATLSGRTAIAGPASKPEQRQRAETASGKLNPQSKTGRKKAAEERAYNAEKRTNRGGRGQQPDEGRAGKRAREAATGHRRAPTAPHQQLHTQAGGDCQAKRVQRGKKKEQNLKCSGEATQKRRRTRKLKMRPPRCPASS